MEPAERYEKLCAAAAGNSKQFLERRSRRKKVAMAVTHYLAKFLGCPEGGATVVEVDESIRSKGQKLPISSDITLRRGEDNLWYFGVNLRFEKPDLAYFGEVTLYIGVDAMDGGYVVRHESTYRVSEINEQELQPLMQKVYEDILENYWRPSAQRQKSIGFIHEAHDKQKLCSDTGF